MSTDKRGAMPEAPASVATLSAWRMDEETYQALLPLVRGISEAASRLGPPSLLLPWRRWSWTFCSASIASGSAFIAADGAESEAEKYEASDTRRQIAKAAAAAASAVFYVGRPRMAQAYLAIARALAADFAQHNDRQLLIVDLPFGVEADAGDAARRGSRMT